MATYFIETFYTVTADNYDNGCFSLQLGASDTVELDDVTDYKTLCVLVRRIWAQRKKSNLDGLTIRPCKKFTVIDSITESPQEYSLIINKKQQRSKELDLSLRTGHDGFGSTLDNFTILTDKEAVL